MITRANFEKILEVEIQGRDLYRRLLERLTDPTVKEVLGEILKDEEKHVEIARRMLGQISSHKPSF